jgi:hypothetical protein
VISKTIKGTDTKFEATAEHCSGQCEFYPGSVPDAISTLETDEVSLPGRTVACGR